MTNELWQDSYFYELHSIFHVDKVDITQWPTDSQSTIQCNVGIHTDLSMIDWLRATIIYNGDPEEADLVSQWSCIDSYQFPDSDGKFGGQDILVDTYQNCYILAKDSGVSVYEEDGKKFADFTLHLMRPINTYDL